MASECFLLTAIQHFNHFYHEITGGEGWGGGEREKMKMRSIQNKSEDETTWLWELADVHRQISLYQHYCKLLNNKKKILTPSSFS